MANEIHIDTPDVYQAQVVSEVTLESDWPNKDDGRAALERVKRYATICTQLLNLLDLAESGKLTTVKEIADALMGPE